MDIVVYTTRRVLEHKKGQDGFQYYFWQLSRAPRDFNVGDRIYFACNKEVQGYFVCEEFNPGEKETVVWDKNSWVELESKIPCNGFRGFRYKWW